MIGIVALASVIATVLVRPSSTGKARVPGAVGGHVWTGSGTDCRRDGQQRVTQPRLARGRCIDGISG